MDTAQASMAQKIVRLGKLREHHKADKGAVAVAQLNVLLGPSNLP